MTQQHEEFDQMPQGDGEDKPRAKDVGADPGGFVRSRIEDSPGAAGEDAGNTGARSPTSRPAPEPDYYDEPAVPPLTAAKTGIGVVLKAALGVLAVAWLVRTMSERD